MATDQDPLGALIEWWAPAYEAGAIRGPMTMRGVGGIRRTFVPNPDLRQMLDDVTRWANDRLIVAYDQPPANREATEAGADDRYQVFAGRPHVDLDYAPEPAADPDEHDHKGYSEERCVRCGWVMGHPPLNCNNDNTPHVFPSQFRADGPTSYFDAYLHDAAARERIDGTLDTMMALTEARQALALALVALYRSGGTVGPFDQLLARATGIVGLDAMAGQSEHLRVLAERMLVVGRRPTSREPF